MIAGSLPWTASTREAMESLVDEHYGLVFRSALAISGNAHDAEDIAQEAFLAIARGIRGFRGEARLSTWIYRVTVRVAIRWLARHRRDDAEITEEPVAGAPGLPAELIQALGRLPVQSRTVLMLVAVEGFTHAEAADALGVPEGTIASRVHTARRQLKGLLSEY